MEKTLIVGVAGFLGSNLANSLTASNNQSIFGLDNLKSSALTSLFQVLRKDNFDFIQTDAKETIPIEARYVYNCSGSGDLSEFYDNPYEYVINQLEILKNLLEYSKLSGSRLFHIVGFNNLQTKNSLYNSYLNIASDLINEYSQKYFVDAKVVKVDEVYGLNMKKDDKRFIPQIIIKAFNNEDIILEESEYSYYSFSDDVTNALITAMDNFYDKSIIELSSGALMLNTDVAKLITNFTKSKSRVLLKTNIVNNINFKPSLDFQEHFNYKFKTPFLEGISKTIDFFKLMYFS